VIETRVSPSEGELDDTVGGVVSVVVVLSLVVDAPSSLLLHEMKVRLKRNMEKMMSICLTWFPISGLGEPKIYHQSVCFSRIWDFTWSVSDCEELSGGYSQEMMGLVLGGFYLEGSEYGS